MKHFMRLRIYRTALTLFRILAIVYSRRLSALLDHVRNVLLMEHVAVAPLRRACFAPLMVNDFHYSASVE
jgi:hypothetical protein